MIKSPFLDNRERLFENEIGFVVFDKYPVNKGHCLVLPHRIYSNYFDSTDEEIIGLNKLIFQTKDYLDREYQPSGYNIGVNCGQDAGQTVEHLHIHIIPRYLNDVEDGGTEFEYQKITSPAKKGLTIIWPSDWTHTHRGQISQTHKKKVITGWLNYRK